MSPIETFFDALAPSWHEEEDDSILLHRKKLIEALPLKEGDKVLDVACGPGTITALLEEKTKREVLGIDISGRMIEEARRKASGNPFLSFRKEDFYETRESGYDAVVLFDAYPHFLDRGRLKDALLRTLRKGGLFLLLHDQGRAELRSHPAHHDPHLSRDLLSPKEEAGFYQGSFDLLLAEESPHDYRIYLRKK